jgi:hypothetical protein
MAMLIPESWRESALSVLKRDRRGTDKAISDEMAQEILTQFRDQEFRKKFFEIVGHKYVLAMQHYLTADSTTKQFSRAQWKAKLGVDSITIWRWKNDLSMAGGEKFFAAQLLLTDIPITNLKLPHNDIMLERSVVCACNHLGHRYDPRNYPGPITIELFRIIRKLMHLMTISPEALYNPFNETQPAKSIKHALKTLTNHLAIQGGSSNQPKVLPSDIKSWLDGWGMGFAMFVIGNHLSWKQLPR